MVTIGSVLGRRYRILRPLGRGGMAQAFVARDLVDDEDVALKVLRDARLAEALRAEFEHARDRGKTRIDDAMAPYSRFVRAERERWSEARSTLTALRDQAATFRSRLAA